ncbi:MAG: hypothetical protein WBB07_03220 [Mycobacterium sp.]
MQDHSQEVLEVRFSRQQLARRPIRTCGAEAGCVHLRAAAGVEHPSLELCRPGVDGMTDKRVVRG